MTGDAASVVTLGETLALFAQSGPGVVRSGTPFAFRIGGAESNVAIGLARLGVDSAWIGRVGRDPFGDEVVRALRGEGVRVLARRDERLPTGLMVKDRRTARHQRVSYYRAGSAGAALEPSDVDPDVIAAARVLHTTGITFAISDTAAAAARHGMRLAADAGAVVSFDVNHRSRLWSDARAREALLAVLPLVDLLFAGPEEAALLLGGSGTGDPVALARRLQGLGPSGVVLKLGDRGAVAVDGPEEATATAVPVEVVDTVGAGDAFVAGWHAAALGGADLRQRLATACRTGAFACTAEGDWEGSASTDDLALLDAGDPVRR